MAVHEASARALVFWVIAVLLIEALFVVSMLIGSDLFNNKVIEAEKLEPQQAKMLFLTDDYIGDFSEDEFSESPDLSTKSSESLDSNLDHKLSQSQRREVFDRLYPFWYCGYFIVRFDADSGLLPCLDTPAY